jgi:D-alanyl-D-alanine carboxypeptidase
MTIWGTILMVVFFPLNSFFLIQSGLIDGKQVQAENSVNLSEESEGLVKGVTSEKNEKDIVIKAQAVDNPEYIPIRREGVKDLIVPGAHASIIIDADTGTIMHYNNGKEQRQIASLTKLMTAILVIEKIKNLDEEITIDEEAVYVEGTKIGCMTTGNCTSQRLTVGEKVTARNLLQAMLMNSTNDTAIALAKHISGTQKKFAELMNAKAKELGLPDTHFCTPSGLEPDGREKECFSSAYDIARVATYSLRYDTIWNAFRLPDNSTINSSDGKIVHTIRNTNVAFNENRVQNIIGGKTGFTPMAGYSLLMAVTDQTEKHRIIAVVLDDSTRWNDIKNMVDWAFDSYAWQ